MSEKQLPPAAYAALQGLKGQADAVKQMIPTNDIAVISAGKKALGVSQKLMAENSDWVNRIISAIRACRDTDVELTVVTADTEWLERTFA